MQTFKNWGYGAPAKELKKCVWANTFYAHCALMYVFEKKGWNAKHLFKTYLLEVYYEENRNISLPEVLCDAYMELFKEDAKELSSYLSDETGKDVVEAVDANAKRRGISGVIINK